MPHKQDFMFMFFEWFKNYYVSPIANDRAYIERVDFTSVFARCSYLAAILFFRLCEVANLVPYLDR